MVLLVSISNVSPLLAAEKHPTTHSIQNKTIPADVKVLLNRLEEIKTIDKSALNRSEKRALRKEVRAIKSELKTKNHGVYLSVGAFIIIILLLVILL